MINQGGIILPVINPLMDQFDAKQKTFHSLVVIGPTGSGKSRMLEILGVPESISSSDVIRGTSTVRRYDSIIERSDTIHSIKCVDTIGLGDKDFSYQMIMDKIMKELVNVDVNTVIMTFKFDMRITDKFIDDTRKTLKLLQKLNIQNEQLILVYTHCDGIMPETLKGYHNDMISKIRELNVINVKVYLEMPRPEQYKEDWRAFCEEMLSKSRLRLLNHIIEQRLTTRIKENDYTRFQLTLSRGDSESKLNVGPINQILQNAEKVGKSLEVVHNNNKMTTYMLIAFMMMFTAIIVAIIMSPDKTILTTIKDKMRGYFGF
jgi:hypothetical protein